MPTVADVTSKMAEEARMASLYRVFSSLVLLGVAFFAGVQPLHAQGGPQPVILAKAKKAELVDRVEALGTLRANEQVTITAQVTETITEILFEDGQRVEKGDTLALMTSGIASARATITLEPKPAMRENIPAAVLMSDEFSADLPSRSAGGPARDSYRPSSR